ncbi:AraC family transcriptional regulator [Stenotrophomonas sp. PS02289]|uniref:helix-turn-helix domain-containing protein n=1 Tax=Stenotrophomonas sp. PS02289 TaxID=2991422 RepID=UPI00249C90D5|nr:AraC family transcriptional regulator [Stenotrophomonas sp. PS02289]
MKAERLKAISRAASNDSVLLTDEVSSGVCWHSTQHLDQPVAYDVVLPAGLHLAVGVATLKTSAGRQGEFTLPGMGLTAVYCAEDVQATTQLAAGPNRSCGLMLPTGDTQEDHIQQVIRRLREGPAMRATSSVPAAVLDRLCAPLDPWFQGHARAMALEARSLELMAVVWTWLNGEPERVVPPSRHIVHAHRARELLETQLAAPPSLARLARQVGVNVRTLTDVFRSQFGMSIASYVTRRRLQIARDHLLEGLSVSAAAHRVGYAPAHFSNAFQRQFGIRPQAFVRAMPTGACEMPDGANDA